MQGKTTRGPKRGSNPNNRGRKPKRKKIPMPRNTFSSRRKEDATSISVLLTDEWGLTCWQPRFGG